MSGFQPLQGTNPSDLAQLNKSLAQLNAEQTTKIFKDDTGTRRVLLGKGKDNFYGMKVSQEGHDVYDAADSELVFNSSQNVFKIVSSGSFTITGAATSNTTTSITHNLGFRPTAFVYVEAGINAGARRPLPTWSQISRDDVNHVIDFRTWIDYEVTSTQLHVIFFNSTATAIGPFTITYYLLQESI